MIYEFERSKLLCLPAAMELFIIYAQGVSPRVVIWPKEMQDSLKSMVFIAAGTT